MILYTRDFEKQVDFSLCNGFQNICLKFRYNFMSVSQQNVSSSEIVQVKDACGCISIATN